MDICKLHANGDFMRCISDCPVKAGTVGIFSIGQAGFIFKTADGKMLCVDPYLSDYCERTAGFIRMTPPLIPPEDFFTDALFMSHEHEDHFDVDLLTAMKKHPESGYFGPEICGRMAADIGIPDKLFTSMSPGETVNVCGCTVTATKADHGESSPQALGFIFDFGFVSIYFAGDTAYSPDILSHAYNYKPDVALLPINGFYGNLNGKEAALLAKDIGVKLMIPCHYWTFIEHGSYPFELKTLVNQGLDFQVVFLPTGRYICV